MNKTYPRRQPLSERIDLVVTTDLKQRVFEKAAAEGKPASEFIREAITRMVTAEIAA
jgi:hypothetical protein